MCVCVYMYVYMFPYIDVYTCVRLLYVSRWQMNMLHACVHTYMSIIYTHTHACTYAVYMAYV